MAARTAAAGAVAISAAPLTAPAVGQCEPAWSEVGGGMTGLYVIALTEFDDGSGAGPSLYAGGAFDTAGGTPATRVARWDGAAWSPLGSGLGPNAVRTLGVSDDGSGGGPALYAGGWFTAAGPVTVNCIAKWDGSEWSALGSGMAGAFSTSVADLAVFDDGSGPALYAGGGNFTTAGGVSANYIAKWDGATWSPLGSGMNWAVEALAVFDDGLGGGPALYAGGGFSTAGSAAASRIAKWDGASWSPLGSGIQVVGSTWVYDLTVFDDGAGPALYAAGSFTGAGAVPAMNVARWDGVSWSPVGSGLGGSNPYVSALAVFDDGSGEALYAAGNFTTAGGMPAQNIAKWDGAAWTPLGSGMDGSVDALTVFDDGSGRGPALYAGGHFTTAGGQRAVYVARWGCEGAACYADCDSSAALDFFDFLCFQNLFAAGDPGADCDGSGAHDFFDFLCFQNAFAAGCR